VPAFHRELVKLLEAGHRCATATLVGSEGSTPAKQGHRLIVLPGGAIRFTMGGGPLEAMVIADCLEQLACGTHALREYRLVPEGEQAVGMVCGGTAKVFIEVHEPEPQLMVFGAGHVGLEILRMAPALGLACTVVDDRAEMLAADRFPASVRAIHCPRAFSGDLPATREGGYVVIVTRCHETDREILARLADRRLAYLGMIGSRRKVRIVMDELRERGIPAASLERVRAPVGLEIGARTPAEIAVSILAEIVAVRHNVHGTLTWPTAKQHLIPTA
jgi:xanthine dehydrogenase accessory factor